MEYLTPKILSIHSELFNARLQGTGIALICEDTLCGDALGWGCDAMSTEADWYAYFYAPTGVNIDSCRIVAGDQVVTDCEYKTGPICSEGRLYSISCNSDVPNCELPIGATVSVVCDGAQGECSGLQ